MATLEELLNLGKSHLQGKSTSAVLESRILLQHVSGLTEAQFFSQPGREATNAEARRFFRLIKKRRSGIPLAYLLGRKEFWSLSFLVNRHTLIPRPETELLVDRAVTLTSDDESIAEIGTGSGNIAAAIASVRPTASITATDVSRKALRIARGNLERLGITNVRLLHGPLFRPLRTYNADLKLDLILSNPPYVSEEEWFRLPRSIRDYEPRRALVSGPTGLETISRLIKQSPPFLKSGGFLIFEIGFGQRDRVISLFPDSWSSVISYNDINAIPRVIEARR